MTCDTVHAIAGAAYWASMGALVGCVIAGEPYTLDVVCFALAGLFASLERAALQQANESTEEERA